MGTEDLRLAVYRQLAATGRAPSRAEVSDDAGLRALHEQRHLVLGDDGEIVLAHPFSTVPLGFSVMGARTLWWGGCAWDSFAIPHLVPDEPSVLVATTCPACEAPLAWTVTAEGPPAGDERCHFLVPAAHVWDDVVHACGNQRIFCGEACIAAWLDRTGHERGSVFDLTTLWRLAAGWYAGRLDRGYVRREPIEAKAYFAEVGLRGAFWGLGDDELDRPTTLAPVPDDLLTMVGVPLHPATGDGPVEVGPIRDAAAAVEDANPLVWDGEVADALTGGPVATPTMLSRWLRPRRWSPGATAPAVPLTLHFEVKARLDLPDAVVTEQATTFHEPVRPGDVLSSTQVLRSIGAPTTTSLGTGRTWVIDVEVRNQRDDLVGVETYTAFGYRR